MSTVLTSSCYRGAILISPHKLRFLKNIHPWLLFQQRRHEAYLRQAPQARCGPKWTISRSEQYPEGPYMYSPWSEQYPEGPYIYSPWSLFNICGRGEHLLNKFDKVIETPGQLLWVNLFWIKLHWFTGTCFVQYSNAGFSDQTCNMHPWRWSFQWGCSNNRLDCLIIFCIQGCFICCYFVSRPKPLQSY